MTVDLRSDTFTRPTPAMRRAMAEAEVGDDVWREDPTVQRLEAAVAERLGHQAALFVPSGTMGNQICLRLAAPAGTECLANEDNHIFWYESGAAPLLSGIQLHAAPGRRRRAAPPLRRRPDLERLGRLRRPAGPLRPPVRHPLGLLLQGPGRPGRLGGGRRPRPGRAGPPGAGAARWRHAPGRRARRRRPGRPGPDGRAAGRRPRQRPPHRRDGRRRRARQRRPRHGRDQHGAAGGGGVRHRRPRPGQAAGRPRGAGRRRRPRPGPAGLPLRGHPGGRRPGRQRDRRRRRRMTRSTGGAAGAPPDPPGAGGPPRPFGLAEVERAAGRIAGRVHRTPVLTARLLDRELGCRVVLKAEHLQRTGAFKARGAFSALLALDPAERARGVLAVSSGNHGQAVALAAAETGGRALVVMPAGSNPAKVAATRAYGAEVLMEGVTADNREAVVLEVAAARGLRLVHPFDDAEVMAGQGTAALELLEDAGLDLDLVLVPVGGGGLISGTAAAVKGRSPATRVVGVEPATAADARASLAAGRRIALPAAPATIADGVRSLCVGERPFEVMRRLVDEIVTVTDAELRDALALYWSRTKQLVEPTAALPLAALLTGAARGGRVGVVLSGGNVDATALARCLTGPV